MAVEHREALAYDDLASAAALVLDFLSFLPFRSMRAVGPSLWTHLHLQTLPARAACDALPVTEPAAVEMTFSIGKNLTPARTTWC